MEAVPIQSNPEMNLPFQEPQPDCLDNHFTTTATMHAIWDLAGKRPLFYVTIILNIAPQLKVLRREVFVMSAEVKRYYDDLSASESLQNRMQQLAENSTESFANLEKDQAYDRIVAFANAEGYGFTKADLISFENNLSDFVPQTSQADTTSNCEFVFNPPPPTPFPPDFPPWFDPNAVCSLGGYIKCSAGDHTCACFFGGGGHKDSRGVFLCCVALGFLM